MQSAADKQLCELPCSAQAIENSLLETIVLTPVQLPSYEDMVAAAAPMGKKPRCFSDATHNAGGKNGQLSAKRAPVKFKFGDKDVRKYSENFDHLDIAMHFDDVAFRRRTNSELSKRPKFTVVNPLLLHAESKKAEAEPVLNRPRAKSLGKLRISNGGDLPMIPDTHSVDNSASEDEEEYSPTTDAAGRVTVVVTRSDIAAKLKEMNLMDEDMGMPDWDMHALETLSKGSVSAGSSFVSRRDVVINEYFDEQEEDSDVEDEFNNSGKFQKSNMTSTYTAN